MRGKGAFLVISVFLLLTGQGVWAASFLENEAGISAFCKLGAVNLNQAATAYKSIEYRTADYIIGSVAIDTYPESDDAHVYVHSSGNMIAYYLKNEKVAKIIDWKSYYTTGVLAGSKLETALKSVANTMGQTPTNVQYYDFRFPDAKSIKIVLEEARNVTETFRLNIPSSYIVYNRSFSHAIIQLTSYSTGGTVKLDGTVTLSTGAGTAAGNNWRTFEGELSPSQLSPDTFHTVSIVNDSDGKGYVAIILLYTEP